jgi:hypothetical protein
LQPLLVFSNSTVHRGKTHQLALAGEPAGHEPGWIPWIGLENGATADEPRSNKVLDAMTQTPSDWPIIERSTQEGSMTSRQ